MPDDLRLTIDTLSPAMRRNLTMALAREPQPLRRLHFGQAKALEQRGLVTIQIEQMTHSIDVMLGSANVRLTDAGRGIARAIERGPDA